MYSKLQFICIFSDYPTIVGFEPLINQRLLPPTFPRYTVIKPRLDSLNYMATLVKKLQTITTIPDLGSLHCIFVRVPIISV